MIGNQIGPFELVEQISKGSLGILYRAYDRRMRRDVALRLFDVEITSSEESAMHFAFELEQASKVNHPNLCSILDVGKHDEQTYVVMEFLEGESLKDRLTKERPSMDTALDWARQLSEAVDAVHSAGVIHGFICPRNVFITDSGQIKLLDTGISGLQSGVLESIIPYDEPNQSDLESKPAELIEFDNELSTLHQHSPEILAYQAPEVLDNFDRNFVSDVFSLGCVIYEINTGVRAFPGTAPHMVLDAVRYSRPLPPSRLAPFLPIALEQKILEMLEREPQRRMQSASEIHSDLQRIRRDRTSVSMKTDAYPINSGSRNWSWLLACISLFGIFAFLITGHERQTIIVENSSASITPNEVVVPTVLPLTTDVGMELHAVVSPFGNQIAYAWQGSNDNSTNIYLRLIEASEPFQLSNSDATELFPCWSPDGGKLAFVRLEDGVSSIVVVSALGGTEQTLYQFSGQITSRIDWSADGNHIVFSFRDNTSSGITELNVDSRTTRILVSDTSLKTRFLSPAYSSDNTWLAYVRRQQLGREDIYLFSRDTGETTPLTLDHAQIQGLAWCNDSKHIIASSTRNGLPTLWRFSIQQSPPTLVAGAGLNATYPSIARHANALVHSIEIAEIDIIEQAFDEFGGEETTLIHSSRHDFAPSLSHDGKRIAFISNRTGFEELWTANLDGTELQRITALRQPLIGLPYWSHDDKQILFNSYHESHRDLYVVPTVGGRVLDATGPEDTGVSGSFGRDPNETFFRNDQNESFMYDRARRLRKSPPVDGMWFSRFDPFNLTNTFFVRKTGAREFSIHQVDLEKNVTDLPFTIKNGRARSLQVDQGSVYWLQRVNGNADEGTQHLWRYDRQLKSSTVVATLNGMIQRYYGFTIGPQGDSVIYGKLSETQTDIVLIRDFE